MAIAADVSLPNMESASTVVRIAFVVANIPIDSTTFRVSVHTPMDTLLLIMNWK